MRVQFCLVRETCVYGEFLKDVLKYKEYAFVECDFHQVCLDASKQSSERLV